MTQPAPDNSAQIDFWNGLTGETWASNQASVDSNFAPLTAALLAAAAPAPGEAAIDVGCGCGETTLAVARAAGASGRVVGVDVSAPMQGLARKRAEALTAEAAPVEWVLHDAATHPFRAHEFDLLISRFGVMFFADPAAAFGNLRRAMKPGGRLAMLCWRTPPENPWFQVPRAAVLPLVPPPEPVPPDAPGPFAFADPERVIRILAEAGFAAPHAAAVDADLVVASGPGALEQATGFCTRIGPVAALLREATEATRMAARAAMSETLRAHLHGDRIALAAACWLYTARVR